MTALTLSKLLKDGMILSCRSDFRDGSLVLELKEPLSGKIQIAQITKDKIDEVPDMLDLSLNRMYTLTELNR